MEEPWGNVKVERTLTPLKFYHDFSCGIAIFLLFIIKPIAGKVLFLLVISILGRKSNFYTKAISLLVLEIAFGMSYELVNL